MVVAFMLVFLNLFITDSSAAPAKAKLSTDAKATDCKACHGDKAMLPNGHCAISGQSVDDCKECHQKEKSLRGRIPLSHIHYLSGVSCGDCHHPPQKAEPLETKQCLACHESPEKLSQITAKLEYNPHNSPHYETGLDCNFCHFLHKKSENYCAQCHEWQLRVP